MQLIIENFKIFNNAVILEHHISTYLDTKLIAVIKFTFKLCSAQLSYILAFYSWILCLLNRFYVIKFLPIWSQELQIDSKFLATLKCAARYAVPRSSPLYIHSVWTSAHRFFRWLYSEKVPFHSYYEPNGWRMAKKT